MHRENTRLPRLCLTEGVQRQELGRVPQRQQDIADGDNGNCHRQRRLDTRSASG